MKIDWVCMENLKRFFAYLLPTIHHRPITGTSPRYSVYPGKRIVQ